MNIYIHSGKGHYIGSKVIVAAYSEDEAKEVIRNILDNGGLKHEPLNIVESFILDKPWVIYADNGDY